MLCIDDTASNCETHQISDDIFVAANRLEAARQKAKDVGATDAVSKSRLPSENTVVIGAEIEGFAGYMGAPRFRRRALSSLMLRAVRGRALSKRAVELLCWGWASVFM